MWLTILLWCAAVSFCLLAGFNVYQAWRLHRLNRMLFAVCLTAYLNRAWPLMVARGVGIEFNARWLDDDEQAGRRRAETKHPLW